MSINKNKQIQKHMSPMISDWPEKKFTVVDFKKEDQKN
jgi:hypothetical protein